MMAHRHFLPGWGRKMSMTSFSSRNQSSLISGIFGWEMTMAQITSAIFETGKMTRRIHTDIRLLFKGAGADVLPTYENLDKFRKKHRPPIQELQDPYQGIKFNYEEALKLTTSQLLKSINIPVIHNPEKVHLTVHDGLEATVFLIKKDLLRLIILSCTCFVLKISSQWMDM